VPSKRPIEISCFQPVLCEMTVYDVKCAFEMKCQHGMYPSATDMVLQK